jgi:hypothetical protein
MTRSGPPVAIRELTTGSLCDSAGTTASGLGALLYFPVTRVIGSVLDQALNLLGLLDPANTDPILSLRSELDGLS